MIEYDWNATICVQQRGKLNGSQIGRAHLTLTFTSGATVQVQARRVGTQYNAATVVVTQGNGPVTTVQWLSLSLVMTVILGTVATGQNVADAIEAATDPESGQLSPLSAAAEVTPTMAANALASAPLTGGLNPTGDSGLYYFDGGTGGGAAHAGMFQFDHKAGAMLVREVIGALTGGDTGTISIVDLDDSLTPISTTEVVVQRFTAAATTYEFGIVDTHIPILPKQALLVKTAGTTNGIVRVFARHEGMQTTT